MTNWRIQLCPNRPAANLDDGANLDDDAGNGLQPFREGWWEAWEYITGNVKPGDTVTVLEPDPDG